MGRAGGEQQQGQETIAAASAERQTEQRVQQGDSERDAVQTQARITSSTSALPARPLCRDSIVAADLVVTQLAGCHVCVWSERLRLRLSSATEIERSNKITSSTLTCSCGVLC